jgi:hypothetical protein
MIRKWEGPTKNEEPEKRLCCNHWRVQERRPPSDDPQVIPRLRECIFTKERGEKV